MTVVWRPWTPTEDDQLRKAVMAGMRAAEIAAELKRSIPAVRNRGGRLGLTLAVRKPKK
jgi:hypothetical protein